MRCPFKNTDGKVGKSGLQQGWGWLPFRARIRSAANCSGMQVVGAGIPGLYRFAAHGIRGDRNSCLLGLGQIESLYACRNDWQ